MTRLLGLLFGAGALRCRAVVPTCVLVAVTDEDAGRTRDRIAAALRGRGHRHRGAPVGGEVRQADPVRRAAGHPVRLVPGCRRRSDEVKDIRSGEQVAAVVGTWSPPRGGLGR